MTTPRRGVLFHFTHVSNLASIARDGLCCDSEVEDSGGPITEVGNQDIKERRRQRRVPIPPGGVVADYVPFYFAARSPMLYAVHRGNVPTYDGGQNEIVYLVTNIDSLGQHGLQFVFTDRNAALGHVVEFGSDPAELDEFVGWKLMEARMWSNTAQDPDRRDRRMAELLVYRHVPWSAITEVAARTKEIAERASEALASVGVKTPVVVKSGWYF